MVNEQLISLNDSLEIILATLKNIVNKVDIFLKGKTKRKILFYSPLKRKII